MFPNQPPFAQLEGIMKRSDLKVGAELYYHNYRDWQLYSHGDRVRVLATEPHDWVPRKGDYVQVERGTKVLVEFIDPDDGTFRAKDVVNLAHLRGPWAETKARQDKVSAERRASEQAAEERRLATNAAVKEVVERAKAAGFTTVRQDFSYDQRVSVEFDELVTLLNAYDKTREGR